MEKWALHVCREKRWWDHENKCKYFNFSGGRGISVSDVLKLIT
jgi:hypothetical protein